MELVLWQLILVSVEYARPVEWLLIFPDLSSLGQCLQLLGRGFPQFLLLIGNLKVVPQDSHNLLILYIGLKGSLYQISCP